LVNLNNYYVDFNKAVKNPISGKDYNPFRFIFENRDKYLQANSAYVDTLKKYKLGYNDNVDIYAIFYCLIASVESMEYPLHESLREDLIKYNLQNRYDVDNIFSVTTKKKAKKSKTGYQTDSRMVRNALGHFDYDLDWKEDGFDVTFNSPIDSNDTMTFTDVEFSKFISNHRFLLQSVHIIHGIMAAFSTMRYYFAVEVDN